MNDFLPNLTPEEKLLLSLCRLYFSEEQKSEIRNLLKEVKDWDHFVKMANEHGIVALSWYNITQTSACKCIPPEYLKILNNAYLINVTRNTYLYDQLDKILELIKDKDVKVVLLKGMALEKMIYGNKGLRQMTDIDILVDQDLVLELRRLFIKNGFKSDPFKSPLYKYLIPFLNTHIPRLSKDDCHVEIHCRLFDQKDNSLTEKLLDFSTLLRGEEYNAFVPSPQLFFLYLISHLNHHMRSGDAQLRQYTDLFVLLTLKYGEIIDEKLINYAIEANLEKELAGMLYLLNNYWKIGYPDWLNKFIFQYDHSLETEKFLSFLKQPKGNRSKSESFNYATQFAIIPGGFRKMLYIIGFIFPSLSFMRNRYRTKTRSGAFFYYPVRWGRSIVLFLFLWLKGKKT